MAVKSSSFIEIDSVMSVRKCLLMGKAICSPVTSNSVFFKVSSHVFIVTGLYSTYTHLCYQFPKFAA